MDPQLKSVPSKLISGRFDVKISFYKNFYGGTDSKVFSDQFVSKIIVNRHFLLDFTICIDFVISSTFCTVR